MTFFRRLQPSHNWGKYENSRFNSHVSGYTKKMQSRETSRKHEIKSPLNEWKKISIRSWIELHFTTILYILSFHYSYRYEINLFRKMYTTNSSVLCSKEKNVRTLYLVTIFSECFWPTLFQTNRISRRIHKRSENLTSLCIFTLNMKQFLWKYHILPTLFWAALIFLRSKQRKY